MLPGWIVATGSPCENEIEIVCENQRLKRSASLCATEYVGHVRSNKRFIARSRATSRNRSCRSCNVEYVESGPQRKSVRRLEPERRTQNHHLRLFAPRQGRADCLHSRHLGRSRDLPEKEKSGSP